MNIKDIVKSYLVENGLDGLYLVDESGKVVCSCPVCGLMECAESCYKPTECVTGYEIIDDDGDHVIRPGREP